MMVAGSCISLPSLLQSSWCSEPLTRQGLRLPWLSWPLERCLPSSQTTSSLWTQCWLSISRYVYTVAAVPSALPLLLQLFLATAPTHSPDFPDSPWEAKALALVSSVTSPDLRVACCLKLLHSVELPWSPPVTSLLSQCLTLPTTNTAELQRLHDLLQMKTMLNNRYGVRNFNFCDSSMGQVSGSLYTSLYDYYHMPHI